MNTLTTVALSSSGKELDTRPESFGELRTANAIANDGAALRQRMVEDGYLFLRDYLDVAQVAAARQYVLDRLAAHGLLDEQFPRSDAITKPGTKGIWAPDELGSRNPALRAVLYAGPMIALYERLLGGPVRHFDYTWFRSVAGGSNGIYPHCDIVYMGRGTPKLCTSWTPIGDIPVDLGGLMILEGSHRQSDKLRPYLKRDVDAYCTNRPDGDDIAAGRKQWQDWDGRLSSDPLTLRQKLGGRWLTTDYKMGDVLIFGMTTVHASLDNHTNRFRLSSDSRYQLASDPIDDRWIGEKPIAHGPAGKRGRIC
jgi:hypothetical protein